MAADAIVAVRRFQGLGHLGPLQDPARVAARVAAALYAARDAAAWAALPRSLTLGLPDRDKEGLAFAPQPRL
jgi:hypothetical protein